ncbi:hypothetical protein AVDCRST_MAG92-240 [uncultured Coleofasciculus sp.]|uniref:Uncharacterized protein n=1 Tax=uncultured Coleofasciculus sp. TaxID=1267456 RepID=A0A6J4H8A9_9CYAN|nr:hypothetical protein AVDCRST_MAG92-240 [uncultured Coleofasciculus sp.]
MSGIGVPPSLFIFRQDKMSTPQESSRQLCSAENLDASAKFNVDLK